ncbi:MAG: arginase family protein, partial [Candidatus Marinimicrobia bacterium]|nr:arginase family protein [Candidatus Neomarinimicrobiota bacterium]
NFDDNPYSHASPFARIMENGLAHSLTQIGIRTMNDHQNDQAKRYNVIVITMNEFSSDLKFAFEDPIYISIDLDGIDPAFAPGVSHPEPGGLSTRALLKILSNIQGKIIGADIVEYNPNNDINNITAITAAKLLKELMGKILE